MGYTIESAKCTGLGRVILPADATEYAEICERFGTEIFFIRPAEKEKIHYNMPTSVSISEYVSVVIRQDDTHVAFLEVHAQYLHDLDRIHI
jgi:CMP-N-acetylneuraminic acid synthetase